MEKPITFSGGQYQPLEQKEIQRLHDSALSVLYNTGVQVDSKEALAVFEKGGAIVDGNSNRVRFRPIIIENALRNVPQGVTLFSRDGLHDLRLERTNVYLGTGGAAPDVDDLDTEMERPAVLQDVANFARLVDALGNLHFYVRPCTASAEVPREYLGLNEFYAAISNTSKHVMGAACTVEDARNIIRMAEIIAGGSEALRKRPFISFITGLIISPLKFDPEPIAVLTEIVRSGIPVALSSAPMAGLTSPITLAGTLVQLHAEELACITLTQMLAPGTPILYGGIPSMTDLHELDYVGGGVEFGLMNAAISQLSQHIDVPCFNSAGVTEAKIPDMQAVYEKTFAICQCVLSGSNCIHHVAGMLESLMKVNYAQMVIDNEIAGMAIRALRGIELDEDRLATDIIDAVGPGGSFIATKHTVKYMRTEFYEPFLADRHDYETWRLLRIKDIRKRAAREAKKILRTHRPLGITPEIDQKIRDEFKIYLGVSKL